MKIKTTQTATQIDMSADYLTVTAWLENDHWHCCLFVNGRPTDVRTKTRSAEDAKQWGKTVLREQSQPGQPLARIGR
jgi:hypothetical protein